jgi:serine/threonine protein kinase
MLTLFPFAFLLFVVFLIQGGDLFDAIAEANKYSEKEASRMMKDLSSALDYLHSINICHRDIKPENLLVSYWETTSSSVNYQTSFDCDNNGHHYLRHHRSIKTLKLADFGLAVELEAGNKLFDVCGTPNYVAPEILSESGYDHKVDIWAAGVIAYVLLCGFPPFVSPENDQDELFDQILTGNFEFSSPAFDDVSLEAKQLIVQMLQVDADERISARQVFDHPWVSVRFLSFSYSLDKFLLLYYT